MNKNVQNSGETSIALSKKDILFIKKQTSNSDYDDESNKVKEADKEVDNINSLNTNKSKKNRANALQNSNSKNEMSKRSSSFYESELSYSD